MGLFRKAPYRISNSAWINESTQMNDDILLSLDPDGHGHIRRETLESMTDAESPSHTSSRSPSCSRSNDNAESFSQKVQLLEGHLSEKEKTISQLQAAETLQSERIASLERQLERLVELSSRECARQEKTAMSKHKNTSERSDSSSRDEVAGSRDVNREEISALQELLARVVAEKDRLLFENNNLKSLLQHHTIVPSSNMPPTIRELDSMIKKENKKNNKKSKGKSKKCLVNEISNDNNGDTLNSSNSKNDPKIENENPTTPAEEIEQSILYQMTCREDCNLKYVGVYNSTDIGNEGLKKLLQMHFSQIWIMIQEIKGNESSDILIANLNKESNSCNCSFDESSLAKYLVEHCRGCSTEKDVLKFCMTNVKVEIQKAESSKSKTKKSKKKKGSKSQKKHKKETEEESSE
eukprot:CAMPEP_0183714862 /NCGR_PEP_ID=MMETSP0737-20130205/9284_1 /TAXON_ID=385413 /ORGANISM="Thalassiosira miniscula, Strain CCMP1093" /LENGTH=408 /DNA_ID=CAMNT_0025943885 /DNA_START=206 /DNA_END=1432 /DNA_ORIENTATION=-